MKNKYILLACALVFLLCGTACAESGIEWNGHTYELIAEDVTWEKAKENCEKAGGHLVTITTEEEQGFLYKQIMNRKGQVFWIGFSDEEDEGNWRWITGEDGSYTHWGRGQPDNDDNNQHHACIHTMAQNWGTVFVKPGQWDDDHPTVAHYYICEWDSPAR